MRTPAAACLRPLCASAGKIFFFIFGISVGLRNSVIFLIYNRGLDPITGAITYYHGSNNHENHCQLGEISGRAIMSRTIFSAVLCGRLYAYVHTCTYARTCQPRNSRIYWFVLVGG